jgi:chemotaxis-related protein WspB
MTVAVPLTAVIGVSELAPVTPLPFAPAGLDGLVLAMGYAVVQMTLAARLGLAAEDDGVLVVAGVDGDVRALKVNFVLAMAEIDTDDITAVNAGDEVSQHLTGVFNWEGRTVQNLDLASLWHADGAMPAIHNIDGGSLLALAPSDEAVDVETAEPGDAFILIETGGERYALRSEEVVELMVISQPRPMPGAPDWLAGLIDRRGTPTLAIATRRLLGHGTDTPGGLALFVQHGEFGAVALIVDRALGIHYFDRGEVYPMSENTAGIASYLVATDGRIVGIIDSALLLDQVAGRLRGLIPQQPTQPVEAARPLSDGISEQVLTLRVGQDRFAIALDRIDRILARVTIAPLPEGGNGFSGMADVGEVPVPVLDLRKRLGDADRGEPSDRRPACALVRLEGAVAGLIVDQVLRIVSIPRDSIDPVGADHRLPISGVFEIGGEMISMLMIDRLLPIMPVR